MLRLLVVLVAVPAISFAVAQGVLSKFDSDWRKAMQTEIEKVQIPPESDGEAHDEALKSVGGMRTLQATPLTEICSSPKLSALWTGCDDVEAVNFMNIAAIVAAALGIGLMLLIGLAGGLSRSSRSLLLALFRPGLYVTILALSGIIFLHAVLAMGAIYYGEGELLGRIHYGIMLAIGLGALTGTGAMISSAFSAVKRATTTVVGKKLDLGKAHPLGEFLQDLTAKVGTSMPDNVVVGLTPNFFVTEASVRCLDGVLNGRTLYVSLPLSRLLTRSEMASVLGHELGHYKGRDTAFSRKFYPIYRGTAQSLAALAANVGDGTRGIALMPAVWTLSYFYNCFASAESKLGRERELHADAIAAQVTSGRTIGIALLKVCAFAPLWNQVYGPMHEAIAEGKQFINLSMYWAATISQIKDISIFDHIDSRQLTHPTDSHPPLGIRLDALGFSVADLAQGALQATPADAAIELISEHEGLEKELTTVEHRLLADSTPSRVPDAAPRQAESGKAEESKECPKCGLFNTPGAKKCDCGEPL